MLKYEVSFLLERIKTSAIQGYKGIRHSACVSAKEIRTDDTKFAIGC